MPATRAGQVISISLWGECPHIFLLDVSDPVGLGCAGTFHLFCELQAGAEASYEGSTNEQHTKESALLARWLQLAWCLTSPVVPSSAQGQADVAHT